MLVVIGGAGTSGHWAMVLEPGDAAGTTVVEVELGEVGASKMTLLRYFQGLLEAGY